MSSSMHRRSFLKTTAAGAFGFTAASSTRDSRTADPTSGSFSEPAREIPVADTADVIVAGAGPAGIAAAVAAARRGARTRLIEAGGCLGGTWTAGLLSWILDSGNKGGLTREIIAGLKERGAAARYGGSVGFDVEAMKLLLEEICLESGVLLQLHTRVVAAPRDRGGRLRGVITESKSGRQAWSAGVLVDATGDGDLAAEAGCGFDYGRPGTGKTQPMSLIVLVAGLDPEKVALFVRGLAEPRGEKNPKQRLRKEMERAGVSPSYSSPTLFYIREGLFCLATNHEYGVDGTDAADITRATLRSRAEVNGIVDALRSLEGIWADLRLVVTPEHIGVREGRRIHGRYTVSTEDLLTGARHDDAVCRVTFPVDVHSTDPDSTKGIQREGVRARPYDIPYRALVAKDVDGLLLAGRLISGDFVAHSSYRVTGNAAAMGEAAGVAAALSVAEGLPPHELPWERIRKSLQTDPKNPEAAGT